MGLSRRALPERTLRQAARVEPVTQLQPCRQYGKLRTMLLTGQGSFMGGTRD